MTKSILKVETDRVPVTEWQLPLGDETGHHVHEYDYVVVPLTEGELTIVDADGDTSTLILATGDAYARLQGVEHNVRNLSNKEIRFTDVELL